MKEAGVKQNIRDCSISQGNKICINDSIADDNSVRFDKYHTEFTTTQAVVSSVTKATQSKWY